MQENRHAREPNHDRPSMPQALCLDPTRKVSSHPMNEDGHSRTLDGERQGAEDDGRKSLTEKFHRSRPLVGYKTRSIPLQQPASSLAFRRQEIASAPMPFIRELHHPEMPLELCQLRVNERNLYQLHIDRETQPPVELIEQGCFSPRKYFAECRYVFQSQLHD